MKIIKIETFHCKPRWMFVKVSTDKGIVGYGEPAVEGKNKIVEAAVKSIGKKLIGKNPLEIERLWQLMYRGSFYRGGPIIVSAISGLEQALWDIKGKYHNMPVYDMLGGKVRDKIRVYPHIDGKYPSGDTSKENYVASAKKRVEEGYKFIKLGLPTDAVNFIESPKRLEELVDKFKAVREAVGNDVDIAIDCHGKMSESYAIKFCKALEPYNPAWIEEPVLFQNVEVIKKIKEATAIPIVTGERIFTKWGFRELIEKQVCAIVQPDCCHAGGILELRKIATMAEVYYMGFAPHNPLGPVSLASCIQVAACTPNFVIQEFPCMDNGWDRGSVHFKKPFEVKDAYIKVPNGPGLGFEFDEESFKTQEYNGEWDNPSIFYEDGSIADW